MCKRAISFLVLVLILIKSGNENKQTMPGIKHLLRGILRYKKIDQVHLVEQFKEVRENPVVGVLLSNGY